MQRIHTAALALTAAIAFVVGGWASFAPASFFDSFPGVLGQWVATDGPYNEHLVRDVGAMYLALGAASVAGLIWRSPAVTRVLGLAWTVFGALHLWYHVTHLDHLATDAAIGTAVSPLLGSTVQGAQAGDRPVAAGAGPDQICVGISLPSATTSAYAAANATVELTFNAEQTKNN